MRILSQAPVFVIVLAVAALIAPLAKADTLDFTLTQGSNTYTFSLPSSPTPDSVVNGQDFVIANQIININNMFGETSNITFRNSSDTGGLDFLDAALPGPQLYTGTEAAPTFRTGQFSLSDSFNLTITPESTGVPEPPTISLLALGILALGTLTHRRLSHN